MVILGVDPGTATTGYGVIESNRGKLKLVEYGCIRTAAKTALPERLAEIYSDLKKIIKKHRPGIAAVESVFFYNNVKTAIAVAQARGVVLLCAHEQKITIAEFTPLQVKNTLTGYGKADKKQIQFMVKTLLGLNSVPKPDDAADAVALAICAANK